MTGFLAWDGNSIRFTLLSGLISSGHTILAVRSNLVTGYPDELLFLCLQSPRGEVGPLEPEQWRVLKDLMPSLEETRIGNCDHLYRIRGNDRVIFALLDRVKSD